MQPEGRVGVTRGEGKNRKCEVEVDRRDSRSLTGIKRVTNPRAVYPKRTDVTRKAGPR